MAFDKDKKLHTASKSMEEQRYASYLNLWSTDEGALLSQLRQCLYEVVGDVYPQVKDAIGKDTIVLGKPTQEMFGDYTTNIALILSKPVGKNPREIAEELVKKLLSDKESDQKLKHLIQTAQVAGPGFINIWLPHSYLFSLLSILEGEDFLNHLSEHVKKTSGNTLSGKKVFVEFAHPNTHKEFHIGHLRNIAIGESVVRILQACGATVFRANYEGDVGLHVAKAIWGVYQKVHKKGSLNKSDIDDEKVDMIRKKSPPERAKFLGQGYALGSKMYEEDPAAKQEIMDLNKAIYIDPTTVVLWKETRQWSLDYFDTIYKRLGTHFDRLFFESEVEALGRKIVKAQVEKGIFVKDKDGSIYFPGEKFGLNNCVFVTKEDYATYEGKEVALEDYEYKTFPFDISIHNVAYEQKNFFQIAFTAVEQVFPYQKNKQFHLAYGMVKLKGGKLSSRTGEVITADNLLDQAKEEIKTIVKGSTTRLSNSLSEKEVESIAEKVAVSAVKYSMLRVNPKMDIAFDLAQSVSFDGDSGPYIQYTYARCKSVLKRGESNKTTKPLPITEHVYAITSEEEKNLLRNLHEFSSVIVDAGRNLSPNLIGTYLFSLSQKFNIFYNKHSILTPGEKDVGLSEGKHLSQVDIDELRAFRLSLTSATAHVLKVGLYLLGIETVERM